MNGLLYNDMSLLLYDKWAKFSERPCKAVLRDVFGGHKLIITKIGTSAGAFTFMLYSFWLSMAWSAQIRQQELYDEGGACGDVWD